MAIYLNAIIDMEPKPKGRPKFSVQGGKPRARTPEATRAWEAAFALHLASLYRGEPLDRALHLSLILVAKRPKRLSAKKHPGRQWRNRKPDADNEIKSVCDALEKAEVVVNDSRICSLTVEQYYCSIHEAPHVHVLLRDP